MDDLIAFDTLTAKSAQFLAACVRGKLNVLYLGRYRYRKTTTLNAVSAFIPGDERIVTIEDAAELQLQQEHVITLEARPPNIEGQGDIRIRELVRKRCACVLTGSSSARSAAPRPWTCSRR